MKKSFGIEIKGIKDSCVSLVPFMYYFVEETLNLPTNAMKLIEWIEEKQPVTFHIIAPNGHEKEVMKELDKLFIRDKKEVYWYNDDDIVDGE
jgi:hypothetical protein